MQTRNGRRNDRPSKWVLVLAVVAAAGALGISSAGAALVVTLPVSSPQGILALASHEWERLPEVARQAASYPDAHVWLTLPREVTDYTCSDCANRVARLVALGVGSSRIHVLAPRVSNTLDEAYTCREHALRVGVRRLMVVTSPYHARRAAATFRKVFSTSGIDVGVAPALQTSNARPSRWWWSAYDRWYVTYEWAALTKYLLVHGVFPFGV